MATQFIQKHESIISSDRTKMYIKLTNSQSEFVNAGISYPIYEVDSIHEYYITIKANNREDGDNEYKITSDAGLLVNDLEYTEILASDLGWGYETFEDDVYSVTINQSYNGISYSCFSETTNVVMYDSEIKYFQNVLAYQRSQNYNPISSTRFNYLLLDSLYKTIKYAELLNLIPSCSKLLASFQKALL